MNLDILHKIMKMLDDGKETLAIVRTTGDGQGGTPSVRLAEAGSDALFTYSLTSNYMSGLIFNDKLLKKYDGIEYIKQNLGNKACYHYPHMFWELLLCQYGNVKGTDMILINEGKAVETKDGREEIGDGEKYIIPHYASIEGRSEQHKGFFDIFKHLEICQKNFSVLREMYIKLSTKTIFLTKLSIDEFYRKTDMNLFDIIEKAYEFCLKCLEEMYNDIQQNNFSKYYKNNLKKFYIEDKERIKSCYEYYKSGI